MLLIVLRTVLPEFKLLKCHLLGVQNEKSILALVYVDVDKLLKNSRVASFLQGNSTHFELRLLFYYISNYKLSQTSLSEVGIIYSTHMVRLPYRNLIQIREYENETEHRIV